MRKGLWSQSEETKNYASTLCNFYITSTWKSWNKPECWLMLTKPKPSSKLEKRLLSNYDKKYPAFIKKKNSQLR